MLWWIFGGTILVLFGLIGWVVWMNWMDRATENTLGRHYDKYSGRGEYEPRGGRYRDYEDDSDD